MGLSTLKRQAEIFLRIQSSHQESLPCFILKLSQDITGVQNRYMIQH